MHISLHWLEQYVTIPKDYSAQMLSDRITLHTAEVEGIVDQKAQFEHIVIGEVLRIYPHPNADKLQLADINIGTKEPMTIVCGDPNIYVGMKAAFAGEGAQVRWHGEGDLVTMKPTKIRGIESKGMICAGIELGIDQYFPEQDPLSVSDFSKYACVPGDNVADVLGCTDIIFEVDNKSLTNRPDLFGHYGFARELATIFKTSLRPYLQEVVGFPETPALSLSIDIPEHIRRLSAVRISGVRAETSPEWLQNALTNVGIRPINTIVDITNYVMYDLGQPLHAFDASKITNETLRWGQVATPTEVTTLDGQTHTLTPDMPVIFDGEKPVSIGLLMGLANSEVDDQTTEIILEASNALPTIIRTTATALGIRTEASARAEKNLDPEMTIVALRKATALLLQLYPEAQITSSLVDVYPTPVAPIEIRCTHEFLETRLGFSITSGYVEETLTRLEFTVEREEDMYTIQVPSHRRTKDISIAEDIVEELARIHGYDNIPENTPVLPLILPKVKPEIQIERSIRNYLAHDAAMNEVYNYSFVSEKNQQESLVGLDQCIVIANPTSEEYRYLRTSLIPNLLVNVRENRTYKNTYRLFEIGRCYRHHEGNLWNTETDLPFEDKQVAGVVVMPKQDNTNELQHPFFVTKGIVENLLTHLRVPGVRFVEDTKNTDHIDSARWAHPGIRATIFSGNTPVGVIGAVHPSVGQNYDCNDQHVIFFVLDITALQERSRSTPKYTPISKFPGSSKELSIVLPEETPYQILEQHLRKASPFVVHTRLHDIFRHPEKVGPAHKSMTVEITLHAGNRTLTDEDIQQSLQALIKSVEKAGGKLRS